MKLKTQIALITLAVAASTSLAWSTTIEGVWQVSRQGVDCNDPSQLRGTPFPAIMTFHRDGTVTGADLCRAVVLILNDSMKPEATPANDWTSKGLCNEAWLRGARVR